MLGFTVRLVGSKKEILRNDDRRFHVSGRDSEIAPTYSLFRRLMPTHGLKLDRWRYYKKWWAGDLYRSRFSLL